MPEVIIFKHPLPTFIYFLLGAGLMGVLLFPGFFGIELDDLSRGLAAFVAVIIGIVTIFAILTYIRNKIVVNDDGITFYRYFTPINFKAPTVDLNAVQSVQPQQGGLFAVVFNYGTLTIKAADDNPQLSMTYIPDVATVASDIDARSELGKAGDA